MSGPKRNPDKLNTIGVVVVGICGAVLVYVTIVALQAFYMNDTSEIQTMADYGGQDLTSKGRRADEMRNISEPGKNAVGPGQESTFRIPIDVAMKLVAEDAKKDPSHLVPALPPSTKPSIEPVFGRPKPAAPPAPAPGTEGSAAGSAAPTSPTTPTTPTGAAGQPQPVPGSGGTPGGAATTQGTPGTNTPAPGAQPTAPAPKSDAKAPATQPAQPKATQPKATQPKATQPKTPAATQPKAPAEQPKNP
ncbi:MAG TPA: hypothetical protein VIV11_28270 [Kofleriaceae bacterium]